MRYSKESFSLQKPTMCITFDAHNNDHFIFTALSIILKQHPPSKLMKHTDINLTVQGLLPYTGEQLSYIVISICVYEIFAYHRETFPAIVKITTSMHRSVCCVRMCHKFLSYTRYIWRTLSLANWNTKQIENI